MKINTTYSVKIKHYNAIFNRYPLPMMNNTRRIAIAITDPLEELMETASLKDGPSFSGTSS